jgi:hypothetical protein
MPRSTVAARYDLSVAGSPRALFLFLRRHSWRQIGDDLSDLRPYVCIYRIVASIAVVIEFSRVESQRPEPGARLEHAFQDVQYIL